MKAKLLLSVAILAALYAIVVTWRENERAAGLDFYIYFVNAQLAARSDIENIYSDEAHARIGDEFYERGQRSDFDIWRYDSQRRRYLDTVSSPFLYTTLSWVSRDYRIALHQFHLLVILAFVAGVSMIARASRLSWAKAFFILTALLLWYRGFEADLRVGNVNSLQLAAIGATLVLPPFGAGAVLAMLLCFKPNILAVPLLMALARVATRDWRALRLEVLGGAAGGLLAFAIASWHYGSPRVWLQWVERAGEFYQRVPTRDMGNVTPALILYERYGARLSYLLVALLVVIAAGVIAKAKSNDAPLIVGLGVLIYVMSALVVWPHYMVLPLVAAIPLFRERGTGIVAAIALFLLAEEPLRHIAGIGEARDARFIAPALLSLYVAALWAIWKRGSARMTNLSS